MSVVKGTEGEGEEQRQSWHWGDDQLVVRWLRLTWGQTTLLYSIEYVMYDLAGCEQLSSYILHLTWTQQHRDSQSPTWLMLIYIYMFHFQVNVLIHKLMLLAICMPNNLLHWHWALSNLRWTQSRWEQLMEILIMSPTCPAQPPVRMEDCPTLI